MSELVHIERGASYAICTLSLPAKRNPLSRALRDAIRNELDALSRDETIRCVILTGAGSAFCSGLDLESLKVQTRFSPDEHKADAESLRAFFQFIAEYPLPTVAAVNGPAIAGGCGLAVLCDYTITSASAFFSFSEVKIGFVPALVGVYIERMIGPKRCRELLLSGRKIAPEEALAWGMVNAIVPPEELLPRAIAWAELVAVNGPHAVRMTKELLVRQAAEPFYNALESAVLVNAVARQSSECIEGVSAFLERRAPNWVKKERTSVVSKKEP